MSLRSPIASAVALLVGAAAALSHSGLAQADEPILKPGSLVIASTTYEKKGAVTTLNPTGAQAQLPGPSIPSSDDNFVDVWNNANVDGNFGVTSPIVLTAVEPYSGRELARLDVPTDQVVTSFTSKSELALNLTRDADGNHLVFQGYAGSTAGSPGVGALDVSNADAAADQDPTNPVTAFFGTSHFFHRTIVALDDQNRFAFTPTENYGGDNGRAALLGSNGLYYTVGNSNAGSAKTFSTGSCQPPTPSTKTVNCTSPDVTQTTGLEAVNAINSPIAAVTPAIPAVIAPQGQTPGSAEVDPKLQYSFGSGSPDKAGKDDNFRGVTEYNGALYFTKASGSNGIESVYTVVDSSKLSASQLNQWANGALVANTGPATGNVLPTVANASSLSIQVLNGLPTDSASATGGDYAPVALFFASPTTLYVTDEGDNDATDATVHAGLQKWVLNTKTGGWSLAYVLQGNLIGHVDSNLNGYDGPYPDVTTTGLRNLTGRVNKDGTVTLWAATATSSSSGDAGADPNRVVEITDVIAATSAATGHPELDTFRTIAGPTYGTVYRGVAWVGDEDQDHGYGHGGERDGSSHDAGHGFGH